MNVEKLQKMAGAVRTGGKGSVRRKKKAVHKTTSTDDKRLQSTLKRLGVNVIPQIEEVNFLMDDGKVIQFLNPKVQAAVPANTWVVSGTSQTKKLEDLYKNYKNLNVDDIINHLGADNLRKFAEQLKNEKTGEGEGATPAMTTIQEDDDDDDDEVPELVGGETFEAVAEEGQKS